MLQSSERLKPLCDDQVAPSLELCDGQPVEPFDELPKKLPYAVIEIAAIAMRDQLLNPGQAHMAALMSLAEVLHTPPSSREPMSYCQAQRPRFDPRDTELCDQGNTAIIIRPGTHLVVHPGLREGMPMPPRGRSYKVRRAPRALGAATSAGAAISGSLEGLDQREHDAAFRSLFADTAVPQKLRQPIGDVPTSTEVTARDHAKYDKGQPFDWFMTGQLDVSEEQTKRNMIPLVEKGPDTTERIEPISGDRLFGQELADHSKQESSSPKQAQSWWRSIRSIIEKVRGK